MKKKIDTNDHIAPDSLDDFGPAASSMDCTGLIPSGMTKEEELEAYEELYPRLSVQVQNKKE